jgi:diguanylate cyclase (GGDEF)-like protein
LEQDDWSRMFQVFTFLTDKHDWRLIGLAVAICILACSVTVSLFHRAQSTQGHTRLIWLSLDAAAGGCGIWATHFIAMLAYDPGAHAAYDAKLTILSLLFAASTTGVGLSIALRHSQPWAPMVGGIVVGLGIAAMHYTGMLALELPGRITWSVDLVFASFAFGIVFASLAVFVASKYDDLRHTIIASILLAVAILTHHFTAMGAVIFIPDPNLAVDGIFLSPASLSLVIASAAAIILSMSLVAALSDRQSQDMLRRQKIMLHAALENMSQALCMFDSEGCTVLFNERYAKMVGRSAASLQGESLLTLFRNKKVAGDFVGDPDEFFDRVMADIRLGKSSTKIVELPAGRALRVMEQPLQGGGWVATFEDITEWRKAQTQLSYMAHHDALTGLPNRTKFREQLEQALRLARYNNQVAVLCLDLDHFKDINDSLGHPIGDELLKEVARRLSGCLRESDTVSRLGGDEFAIVQVGGETGTLAAATLASRLVEIVATPYDIQDHQLIIGTSVGIALAPDDGKDPDELLKNADLALYRAKADGRGNYRFFETGMDARAQARRLLEIDLRAALRRSEFELYYQPVHDLKTNHIVGFEALVRWNHPLRGLIAPLNFIPLAEETGLIVPIGEWVLRKACEDAAGWSQNVSVAVNLSPVQFRSRNLVSSVVSALETSGLPANRLELEITETVLLQDSDSTLTTLHKLRSFGIRISMDDFGTGYSSLSYLRSFPFDKIKIDRSFVTELATRDGSMAIVRAVTGLGKSLGILTTAEGVETKEQLNLLRTEGCTEVQGYLFDPPRPAADVEKMLSSTGMRVVA